MSPTTPDSMERFDTEKFSVLALVSEMARTVERPLAEAFTARFSLLAPEFKARAASEHQTMLVTQWMQKLLDLLRYRLDDAAIVSQASELIRWGCDQGIAAGQQSIAMQALSWACRDVMPAQFSTSAASAMVMYETLLDRLAVRLGSQ